MARPIRVEFPGAVYHVAARGSEGRKAFRDDADRQQFLAVLEETIALHQTRLHAFCLMPDHYHLLMETPLGNLTRAIGWLQTTYSIRFNHRHHHRGPVFQGRFKAHLVEADTYSTELLRYMHMNPVRPRDEQSPVPAGRRDALQDYAWSSHPAYLGIAPAPAWLCTDWLSFFSRRRKDAQRAYGRFVEDAFGEPLANPWRNLKFGLALGGEEFQKRIGGMLGKNPGRKSPRSATRAGDPKARRKAARALAASLDDHRLQVWLQVTLGSEPRSDVAKAHGYKDGSAVTRILKRLESQAAEDASLRRQIAKLQREFDRELSGAKS